MCAWWEMQSPAALQGSAACSVCLPVPLGLSHPSCSDDWNLSLSLSASRYLGGELSLWREEGLRVKTPLIPVQLGWSLVDWGRKWLVICLG